VAWRLDSRARLGAVRAPALVLAGRCDPQLPPDCAQELARGLPNAHLVVFARSGHYPFVEEPDAFWASIDRFLVEHEDDAGSASSGAGDRPAQQRDGVPT
jgi:pimeloyl-ACP methyl ester carboxylesterase